MRDFVIKTVSKVMKVPMAEVNEDSSPDNLVSWDSLMHMRLIQSLEEGSRVIFSDDQIVELRTVGEIIAALTTLVAEAGENR